MELAAFLSWGMSALAITIDEGIAGYRDEAVRIAAENCKKLGVEHVVCSFKELWTQACFKYNCQIRFSIFHQEK
jgi:tRNA(Ile)-lysidine synthase TilS/MesJ